MLSWPGLGQVPTCGAGVPVLFTQTTQGQLQSEKLFIRETEVLGRQKQQVKPLCPQAPVCHMCRAEELTGMRSL